MLKGIPSILTPELLKVLMEIKHLKVVRLKTTHLN